MKLTKLLIFCFLSTLFSVYGQAQEVTVSGKVIDEDGLPIPGVTILIKTTTKATASDIDGNYQIKIHSKGSLVYSYIGYTKVEESIKGRVRIDVKLVPESQTLQEVVVVGYGTQKKSVVTGAISSVKAKDLENVPNGRIEQALQGRVSGLTVAANAGQPGSASTIRIRGITTFSEGGNDPLWVVDGVVVDNGGIGYLNQSDIESIEVLKDAASLAIYGSRSAGGVILVTTKKGKSGKISVNYSGFSGVSSPEKILKLLNATQYGSLQNEQSVSGGGSILHPNLAILGKGTDWQKAIFSNNASRYSHEISFSGGNDVSTFYISFGGQDQQGIVTPEISNFNKKNIRINSTHKLSKYFTLGESLGYSHQKTNGIGNTNAEQGGPLSSAIHLDPITPLVETDPVKLNNVPYFGRTDLMTDANGNPYGLSNTVQNNMTNPLAYVKTRLGNYDWSDNFVGNTYLEISPIKGLKIRSTLGAKLAYWGAENFTPQFYLNSNTISTANSISRNTNTGFGWNNENIVSYAREIKNHNFTVLVGQGVYVDNISSGANVTYSGLPTSDYKEASFNFSTLPENITASAYTGNQHKLTSLFSRLNYDYKERYLLTGVVRRDGSSRFGPNNKYGIFPSVSGGWAVSKEEFWKDNNVLNTLKIRAGYGVTGNDAIKDFGYQALIGGGRNYPFGPDGSILVGNSPDAPSNPDLKWEETIQTDIGIDAKWFNNSVNMTVDVYSKKTTGILQEVDIPTFIGASARPVGNVADMENRGIELELGFNKKFGGLNFRVSGNGAYVENKVTFLGQGKTFINSGPGFQTIGPLTRSEVGQSRNSFYGFKTAGIFQNQTEIDAYKNATGGLIQPIAKPGDFRWVDTNGDGTITDADKQYLGLTLPKYTFGFNFSADYKGFDLGVFMQGAAGNKIFQGLRRVDIGTGANFQTTALGRWTGEGTSDTYPRLTTNDTNLNFSRVSDFYLEKGDYLRFKLLTLGYSLPAKVIGSIGASKVRFYVQGENLMTFTKYSGYDPEIGGSTMGIDRGYYPQARTFMFGANLQF
ncbi:TonB-dependent receptor [uncultured Flavobacterium sp.]|uniref:SusC/RagA family TonB-linked outer membrane protein n=1 Tax=uncultured Flavobacterium sp. TaxID=165435 RepID=UPI0030CA4211